MALLHEESIYEGAAVTAIKRALAELVCSLLGYLSRTIEWVSRLASIGRVASLRWQRVSL